MKKIVTSHYEYNQMTTLPAVAGGSRQGVKSLQWSLWLCSALVIYANTSGTRASQHAKPPATLRK